jgi:hypothetical protein
MSATDMVYLRYMSAPAPAEQSQADAIVTNRVTFGSAIRCLFESMDLAPIHDEVAVLVSLIGLRLQSGLEADDAGFEAALHRRLLEMACSGLDPRATGGG